MRRGIHKVKRKLILGTLSVIVILMYCEVLIIQAWQSEDIAASELVLFTGKITDYEETEKGGTQNHPVILYKINGYQPFEISNTAYDIAYLSEIREAVENEITVEVGTLQRHLDKARSKNIKDRLLNKIIALRDTPRTLHFRTKKGLAISLEDYNEVERERRQSNLLWGTGIILVAIGVFIKFTLDLWKTRFTED